jgi:hypothetical protein
VFIEINLSRIRSLAVIAMLIFTPKFVYAATLESAVKAGVIFNFAKFIDWPVSTDLYSTFNICVVGDNRLEDSLQVLQGKEIGSKRISVHKNLKSDALKGCQMLFVAEDNDQITYSLLHDLGSAPVVTVSDSPEFVLKGGMIGLIHDGSRVGFEVNLKQVKAKNLHFSAQLLKLAKTVRGLK